MDIDNDNNNTENKNNTENNNKPRLNQDNCRIFEFCHQIIKALDGDFLHHITEAVTGTLYKDYSKPMTLCAKQGYGNTKNLNHRLKKVRDI